jgi:hypothetical protein
MNERTRVHRNRVVSPKQDDRTRTADSDLSSVVGGGISSGARPLDSSTRSMMEGRFGHNFEDVRVHADTTAADSAQALNARAYTLGQDIVFGGGQYAPGTSEGQHLIAHELTHVVQQGAEPASTPMASSLEVSQPGDPFEREADAVAQQVMRGNEVSVAPAVPGLARAVIQRAVKTNGGEFETPNYVAINDASSAAADGVGKGVGLDIDIKFTPNDLIEADNIGMTQTVKTLHSSSAGGAVDVTGNARRQYPDMLTAGEGDAGRGIDRVDAPRNPDGSVSSLPTTNPLYGVHNKTANAATGAAAHVSGSLTDTPASGNAAFGSRKRKADGTFDPAVPATMHDRPNRSITFAGQEWTQTFETTALVLDGPMANTYLGSIEWGWKNDATGNAALNPAAIQIVRAGAPTSDFMDAARKWNNLSFTDPATGTTHQTIDLPTTTLDSGSVAAADRTTSDIVIRLDQVNRELATLAAGTDRTNKEFEKRALEAELAHRGDQPTTTLAAETLKAMAFTTSDLVKQLEALSYDLETSAVPDSARTNKEIERQALENEAKTRNVTVEVKVLSTEDFFGGDEVYAVIDGKRQLTQDTPKGGTASFKVSLAELLPKSRPMAMKSPLKIEIFDQDLGGLDADDLIVSMDWEKPFAVKKNSSSLDGANYDVTVQFER